MLGMASFDPRGRLAGLGKPYRCARQEKKLLVQRLVCARKAVSRQCSRSPPLAPVLNPSCAQAWTSWLQAFQAGRLSCLCPVPGRSTEFLGQT